MRCVLVGAVAVLLLATGCGSSGLDRRAASAPVPARRCADVVVLGLRGQGQSAAGAGGVGAEVLGVARALGSRTPGTVRLVAVRYRQGAGDAAYDADVASGVRMVRREVRRLAARCPDSRVGLVGFSEGAQVAHLAAVRITRPLAFVVLLGDPLRRPDGDPGVRELHFGTRVTGRGSNGAGPAFPARVRPRVVEACVGGDNVCNVPPTGRVGGVSDTHREFYEKDSSARTIAATVRVS